MVTWGSLQAVRAHSVWQGRQGLIQARPVHPGWEGLPEKSNPSALSAQPSAKPSPTPSCSAGDGEGCVPGSWAPLRRGEEGRGGGGEGGIYTFHCFSEMQLLFQFFPIEVGLTGP